MENAILATAEDGTQRLLLPHDPGYVVAKKLRTAAVKRSGFAGTEVPLVAADLIESLNLKMTRLLEDNAALGGADLQKLVDAQAASFSKEVARHARGLKEAVDARRKEILHSHNPDPRDLRAIGADPRTFVTLGETVAKAREFQRQRLRDMARDPNTPARVSAALAVWATHLGEPNAAAIAEPYTAAFDDADASAFNKLAQWASNAATADAGDWAEAEQGRREIAVLEAEVAADAASDVRRREIKEMSHRRLRVRQLARDFTVRDDTLAPVSTPPSPAAYGRLTRTCAAVCLQEIQRLKDAGSIDLTVGERQVLRGVIAYGPLARSVASDAADLLLFLTSDAEPALISRLVGTALEERRISERNTLTDETRDQELADIVDLFGRVEATWNAIADEVETLAPTLAEVLEAGPGKIDEASLALRRVRSLLETMRGRSQLDV